jgi:hypothetical protein
MTQAQQRPYLDDEDYTFPAPNLDEVSPYAARAGDTVTVRGDHLAAVDKCTFQVGRDTRRGEIVESAGDDQMKVRVPRDLPAGNGRISVSNATGESNRIEFTVES